MTSAVIGFDLDMTLVDSAAGIVESIQHVCSAHGVEVPRAELAATIGLPLDQVFPRWVPHVAYATLLSQYRSHYSEHGVPRSTPMPGAPEILAYVRTIRARSVVVTAKHTPIAQRVMTAAGLAADVVAGDLFAAAKAEILRAEGAEIYVGDHPGDMVAAAHADAVGVGVATGPTSADALLAAGAAVVLPDLFAVTDWLRQRP